MIWYLDPSVPETDQLRHAGSVVRGTVVTHCRLRLLRGALRLSLTNDQTHPVPVCAACGDVIDRAREQSAAGSDTIADPLAPVRRRTPVRWTDPLVIAGAVALFAAVVLILVFLELPR